jgi:peptide-methionine (S)-S-oxide reductase
MTQHAVATFGAGCFWGFENAFRALPGVATTRVGYEGGSVEEPDYEMVCTGNTGHAEVVEIEYDPAAISYQQLLETFWSIHDPTQRNRQGPDIGSQYRSIILFHTPEQERAAKAGVDRLRQTGRDVATEIIAASDFYMAEDYHQQYDEKRGPRWRRFLS